MLPGSYFALSAASRSCFCSVGGADAVVVVVGIGQEIHVAADTIGVSADVFLGWCSRMTSTAASLSWSKWTAFS
jgi:hypothetical protein